MSGQMSLLSGRFVANGANGECSYRVWDRDALSGCLTGSWLVVMGGSNANVLTMQLLSLLGLRLDGHFVAKYRWARVIDAIVEGGTLKYIGSVPKGMGLNNGNLHSWVRYLPEISELLAQAPAPNATGLLSVRVTFFLTKFWDQVTTALDALEATKGPWREAPLSIVTQVAMHYVYCAKWKVKWCPDGDYKAMSAARAFHLFQRDMRINVRRLSVLCSPGGRAGHHGCAILNMQFGGQNSKDFLPYDLKTEQIATGCGCPYLRFVDLSTFTRSTPHMLDGHQDPAGATMLWNILFSGACAAATPAQASDLSFSGKACFRAFYHPALCENCPGCEPWECLLAAGCEVRPVCRGGSCIVGPELPRAMPVEAEVTGSVWMPDGFEEEDRGWSRACRGEDSDDNSGSYYTLTMQVHSLERCKAMCARTPSCRAIEFSGETARCEVWTREGGVQATAEAGCYTCLRFNRTAVVPISVAATVVPAIAAPAAGLALLLLLLAAWYTLRQRLKASGDLRYRNLLG